jgi:hypothetical protein
MGAKVHHASLGSGTVIEHAGNLVKVEWANGRCTTFSKRDFEQQCKVEAPPKPAPAPEAEAPPAGEPVPNPAPATEPEPAADGATVGDAAGAEVVSPDAPPEGEAEAAAEGG